MIEAALTTILQKGRPRYANNYLAESIELLELAHCFGMTGYGLQVSANKTHEITEDMSWLHHLHTSSNLRRLWRGLRGR